MIFCIGLNVDTEERRGIWGQLGASGQTKPLIVVQGLGQPCTQDLFAAVSGEIKKVIASVGHRQVLLPTRCGLDDNLQARHAVDGNPITACQEHCGERELALLALPVGSRSQPSSQEQKGKRDTLWLV